MRNHTKIPNDKMIDSMSKSYVVRIIIGHSGRLVSLNYLWKNIFGANRSCCFLGTLGTVSWTETEYERSNLLVGSMSLVVDIVIGKDTVLSQNQISHGIWSSHFKRVCPNDKILISWMENEVDDNFKSVGDLKITYVGDMGHNSNFILPNIRGKFIDPSYA